MEHNPYAPSPAALSGAQVEEPADELEPTSRGRRFANVLIDSLCHYVLVLAVGIVIAAIDASFSRNLSMAGRYLLSCGVTFLYYLPSETLFGRTIGKLVTRTRVVSASGGPPSFLQVLKRTLVRFVPFEAFSFLNAKPVGLHDRWSGTKVISSRRERDG